MKTEELNEYVFATLVDERAFRFWRNDCEKLMDEQGLSAEVAMARMPAKDTYIPNALVYLSELRQKVFAASQE